MGGRIWVESEYGKGSIFFFSIQLLSQPEDKEPKFEISDDIQKLKVLVIDDDPVSRNISLNILKFFGMVTEGFESGILAINRLKEKSFDLIIMDLNMPDLDGIEISGFIRKKLNLKTPIIMLTAFEKEIKKISAEQVEINNSLTKPLIPSSLFDMIMEIFEKRSLIQKRESTKLVTQVSLFKKRIKGCRILVAEDNITNQLIARAVLEGAEIIVEIANNGKEAVEMVKKSVFDAVLMDVQMPEMDGYEATQKIRMESQFKSLPIIAMTAHAMKGDKEKCLAAGMDGYIPKPINQEILFKTLSKMINVKEIS
jgi:CheY-like chemotaxis protein